MNDRRKGWQERLEDEFPFMKQYRNDEEGTTIYRRWGCECHGGWYTLIRACCIAITNRYAEEGISPDNIDLEPLQIKEKFGKLRFYYSFRDASVGIPAVDFVDLAAGEGVSIRYEPRVDSDDKRMEKLRHDINKIVRLAEDRSQHICELCGRNGSLRSDKEISRIMSLCDDCHSKLIGLKRERPEERTEE